MADPSAMIRRMCLDAWIHAKPPLKRALKTFTGKLKTMLTLLRKTKIISRAFDGEQKHSRLCNK